MHTLRRKFCIRVFALRERKSRKVDGRLLVGENDEDRLEARQK